MRMIVHGCEVEYCLPCLLVDLLKVLCHKIYYYTRFVILSRFSARELMEFLKLFFIKTKNGNTFCCSY
jgi:hypothetical protein